MSLQLVMGKSGSGKTMYAYNEVIKLAANNIDKNYILIVPDQYTLGTQRDMVKYNPTGGIINIDVLSFGRLTHRIFSELGEPKELLIDDESKNLILQKMAKLYGPELKILGNNIKKLGYVSEVKSIISEFSQYGIGENDLTEFIENLPEQSILNYKLHDINKLYKGFIEFTKGRFITGEQQLHILSNKIKESKLLDGATVVLDGFTGFTPVQYELIKALMVKCEKVIVTVTIDDKEIVKSYIDDYELFALSKYTIKRLKDLARDNYVLYEDEIILTASNVGRHCLNEELRFLEDNLFRYHGKRYSKEPRSIQVHRRSSVQDEANWVASTIRELVRKEGYRYKDFAIIVSDTETYLRQIHRSCEAMEIPVFSDHKRSILMNSFIEHIRSLLVMREKNYTYESTFRFLKSGLGFKVDFLNKDGDSKMGQLGYGKLNANAVDSLENYALKMGINTYKQWSTTWLPEDMDKITESDRYLEKNRIIFMEQVNKFHMGMSKKNKTVEDVATYIYQFLDEGNLQYKLESRAEYFAEQGEFALEKEYTQIYKLVIELLDKLVSVLREDQKSMRVSTKEFIELFDAGLEEMRIGVIPPSIDSVMAGDIQRTRVGDIKTLFLVGANDTALPGKMSSGGLLSEFERDKFKEKGYKLKPSIKEQMYQHKFYMYLNLTKPSTSLYVTYPAIESSGKPARESYLVNELSYLFKELRIHNSELNIHNSEFTEKNGVEFLVKGYKDKLIRESQEWVELNSWYENQDNWVETINLLKQAHLYTGVDDMFEQKLASQMYGDTLVNSVSRLENYASCPFKYFVQSGLKLRERDIREARANDLGNILHAALENYGTYHKSQDTNWFDLDYESQMKLADTLVESYAVGYSNDLFNKSKRDAYAIGRMKRLMRRSVWALSNQLKGGDFKPEAFELKFGDNNEGIGNIPLSNNKNMELRGTIDRVDIYEDQDRRLVKVVDYKTGNTKLDLSQLYEGIQLQLFIYLDAALKSFKHDFKEVTAAGVFYYGVDDPIVEAASIDQEQLLHSIQKELKPSGLVEENAWRHMDKDAKGYSVLIPAHVNKEGTLSSRQLYANRGELEKLSQYAIEKVTQYGNEILGGNINISPYKSDKKDACTYCLYKNVCGFDCNIGNYAYREMPKVSNEEAMKNFRELFKKDEEESGGENI